MSHIISTSLEQEEKFIAFGCINWNLFLEWIEEETEDILKEFEESKEPSLEVFLFESWKL